MSHMMQTRTVSQCAEMQVTLSAKSAESASLTILFCLLEPRKVPTCTILQPPSSCGWVSAACCSVELDGCPGLADAESCEARADRPEGFQSACTQTTRCRPGHLKLSVSNSSAATTAQVKPCEKLPTRATWFRRASSQGLQHQRKHWLWPSFPWPARAWLASLA